MCKKGDKSKVISLYIKEAFKQEFGSKSGRYNVIFTIGIFLLAALGVGTSIIIDLINLIFSISKLNKTYEPTSNFIPFFAVFIFGVLCFLLMVFVVDKRDEVKKEKSKILEGK